jgi:hypothetical protein
MCVDCGLASPRIAQVDPGDGPPSEVVLSQSCTPSSCSNGHSSAFQNNAPRTSMTNRKSMGESESPCHSPRPWQIFAPGDPLSRTLVLTDARSTDTQSIKHGGNPICRRISKINDQDMESKARAMSAFNRIEAFLMCNAFAVVWTSLKLSWIKRPLMKAFWLRCTNSSSPSDNLHARTLDKSFPR